jgi:hypothetical protein
MMPELYITKKHIDVTELNRVDVNGSMWRIRTARLSVEDSRGFTATLVLNIGLDYRRIFSGDQCVALFPEDVLGVGAKEIILKIANDLRNYFSRNYKDVFYSNDSEDSSSIQVSITAT